MALVSIHFRIVRIFLTTRVCVGSVRDGIVHEEGHLYGLKDQVSIGIADGAEPLIRIPAVEGRRNPQRIRHEKAGTRARPRHWNSLLQRIFPVASNVSLNNNLSATTVALVTQNSSGNHPTYASRASANHIADVEKSEGQLEFRNTSILDIVERDTRREFRLATGSEQNTKDKRLLVAIIFFIMPAFLGFDRCYMGQFIVGIIKGVTFGGFGIVFAVDYVAIMYNCLSKETELNSIFFETSFLSNTIEPAYWMGIATIVFHIFSVCSSMGIAARYRGSNASSLDVSNEPPIGTSPEQEEGEQESVGTIENDPFAYVPPTEDTFGGLPAEQVDGLNK